MRDYLIIGALILVIISLALAQDSPRKIDPIQPVTPIPEERKEPERDRIESAGRVSPISEKGLNLERLDLKEIAPVSGFQESPPQYSPMALKGINPAQGMDGMSYQVQEFKDFRGGWNISTYKTKLAPNEASDLENALWNPQGEMYKRPGYTEHSTPPEILNFLYRYYQQDGDKWTMGGSDTALHFWHEDSIGYDSSGWTYLIGTEGTSGRWDGTTFDDMFVGTHEGIEPVVWDGESIYILTDLVDSFVVEKSRYILVDDTTMTFCHQDTHIIRTPITQASWDNNEWAEYSVKYPLNYYSPFSETTIYRFDLVCGNNDKCLYFVPGFNPAMCAVSNTSPENKFQIFSIFGVDSVWREGQVDSVIACEDITADQIRGVGVNWRNVWECIDQEGSTRYGYDHYFVKLHDSTFYWDSTFNYEDYIFEVTDGAGFGSKCYLGQYFRTSVDLSTGWSNSSWDTLGFFVYGYNAACFDTTTKYRIYAPIALQQGAKFCEDWEDALWLGWTGIGGEQEKNRLIFSEPDDMGNWPPENYVWIESDDGDFITGMIAFEPEGGYRQTPYSELLVSKNQSLYRIFPYYMTGDELDYKTIQVSRGVGCCSNAGMANVEGRFVLFPDQHGVFVYDGKVQEIPISAKIDPVFEAWDLVNLEKVSAIYNPRDRHYYLSYLGFDDDEYPGGEFITVFEMDSAQLKDGYWTHSFDSVGNETGDDSWKFYESAGGYVDIAAKAGGEYAIMFKHSSGATGYKVFLAFFDEDGVQIGDTLRIDADSNLAYADNDDHKLDMNSAGQIIACWTDQGDGNNDIRCQVVDFDTGLVGSNFYVNSDSASNSYDYVFWGVGINEDGVCVITWQDWREYTDCLTEIYAQRFQYPDSLMGDNFKVNNCWVWNGEACVGCASGCGPVEYCAWIESKPAVGVGPNTFVVAWISTKCGAVGRTCLYKRAFNIDGTPREAEQLLSDCAGGNIQEPSISMNSRGNYAIAYDKECGAGVIYAIYMMAFNSADATQLGESQVSDTTGFGAQGPDVSINNLNVMTVVWYDGRDPAVQIAYRSYGWNGALMASDSILSSSAYCGYPEIDCFLNPVDTGTYSLAWNIDYHGWSKESFLASAYCYQHSITDDVKILFANPESLYVYNYGTQADDIDDPVILTYQSPYVGFSQWPSFKYQLRFATIEAYLDTGTVYLDWYKDYSDLTYQDSVMCGTDCREEMTLPDTLRGKNISMKLTTGSQIDDFTLSRFWWEGVLEPNRR